MRVESWPGYTPQVYAVTGLLAGLLAALRLRREAWFLFFAAGGPLVAGLVKLAVHRARPAADLVTVVRHLASMSFPSGHVVWATTVGGFLAFVAARTIEPAGARRIVTVGLLVFILLMGPSRVYLGEHWTSDAIGGYLFGILWLALTIEIYRRRAPGPRTDRGSAPGTASD